MHGASRRSPRGLPRGRPRGHGAEYGHRSDVEAAAAPLPTLPRTDHHVLGAVGVAVTQLVSIPSSSGNVRALSPISSATPSRCFNPFFIRERARTEILVPLPEGEVFQSLL